MSGEERIDVLMLPVGSHGDVHPFVGLARVLRARGHEVTFGVNEVFGDAIRAAGHSVIETGRAEEYLRGIEDPDLWHPTRGTPLFLRLVTEWGLRPHFDAVRAWMDRSHGRRVVVASSFSLGARVARDVLGVPLATVHLQPHLLISSADPPIGPGTPEWAPRALRHLVHRAILRFVFDPPLRPALTALRAEHGLPPVQRIAGHYWSSPDRIIGLYPSWFAAAPPDAPAHAHLAGFPLYDEADTAAMPAEVERFLDAGEPPIVFTPGSAMRVGHSFFAAAAEACARLGRRGLLLTRFAEQIPRALPEGVRHFDYVPFSALLPRSLALVHHGGVGTLAQAIRAGIPQLVSPMAHDQFDNAARLRRLGVARELARARFEPARLAAQLSELLEDRRVRARCGELAEECARSLPLERAADLVEVTAPPARTSRAPAADLRLE